MIYKKEILLDKARYIVSKYILLSDEYDIKEFCLDNGIKINEFSDMVFIIMENDSKLYDLYINKINRLYNKEYSRVIGKINKILEGIKNGMVDGDNIQEFDIVDYYKIINIPINSMLRIARRYLTFNDIMILQEFALKYGCDKWYTLDEIENIKKK